MDGKCSSSQLQGQGVLGKSNLLQLSCFDKTCVVVQGDSKVATRLFYCTWCKFMLADCVAMFTCTPGRRYAIHGVGWGGDVHVLFIVQNVLLRQCNHSRGVFSQWKYSSLPS